MKELLEKCIALHEYYRVLQLNDGSPGMTGSTCDGATANE